MKYRVLIQPTAKAELREAYRWYYNRSPSAAEKWLRNLHKAVETLCRNPERCARAPEDDAFEDTIRQLLCGKNAVPTEFFSASKRALFTCFISATPPGRTSTPTRYEEASAGRRSSPQKQRRCQTQNCPGSR